MPDWAGAHGHLKMLHRRELLAGVAWLALSGAAAHAGLIFRPPSMGAQCRQSARPVRPGPWIYFTGRRAPRSRRSPTASFRPIRKHPAARMPAAPSSSIGSWPGLTAAARASTCRPPFMQGTKQQGPQSRRRPGGDNIARRSRRSIKLLPVEISGQALRRLVRQRQGRRAQGARERRDQARRRRRQGVLRRSSSRTCRRASSPIRSTAAIATWSRGK